MQSSSRPAAVLLLLLCCAAATAFAAAPQPQQLFADWLAQKSGKASKVSSLYSRVETSSLCFVETDTDGCSCYGRRLSDACKAGSGACFSYSLDVEMACCNDPAHNLPRTSKPGDLRRMVKEAITAGRCTYTQSYLETSVPYVKGDSSVVKVGDFTGSCSLNAQSETCGGPLAACDGQLLTIQGDIFLAESVAFEAPITSPTRSGTCTRIFAGDCPPLAKAKQQQYGHDNGDDGPDGEYSGGGGGPDDHYPGPHSFYRGYPRWEPPAAWGPDAPAGWEEPDTAGDGYGGGRWGPTTATTTYYNGTGLIFLGTFYTMNRAHGLSDQEAVGIYQLIELISAVDLSKPLHEVPPGVYSARGSEVSFTFLGKPEDKDYVKA